MMKIDNPAFDYDNRGEQYSGQRKTEPRIAEYVYKALGATRTVLNVGAGCSVWEIPVPLHCVDGFQEAFYGRPEAFLSEEVRKAQSAWGFIPASAQALIVKRLADDLASGEWDRQYGFYRTQPEFTCALRLVICNIQD